MSWKSKQRYINPRTNRIKTNVLLQDASDLPSRHRNWQSFKGSFGGVSSYKVELFGYTIVVNLRYAFKHFQDNTYSENRQNINATLLPTLQDPLIVVKSTYDNQDSLTFYKPFRNNDDLLHIVTFQVLKQDDGKYYYKTLYDGKINKIADILVSTDGNTVYFKYEDFAEGSGN